MVEDNKEMQEDIDEDGFKSEEGIIYSITRTEIIPLLHGAIKQLLDRVEFLESKLNIEKYKCNVCNVEIYNRDYDIQRHNNTARHKKNARNAT